MATNWTNPATWLWRPEPVWPDSKALSLFDSRSPALRSLQQFSVVSAHTESCDFAAHNEWNIKMAGIAVSTTTTPNTPSWKFKFQSNTLRHSEVEAVGEHFLKKLGMLNPFLGSAKVKNAYFVWYLRYSTWPTKCSKKYSVSAQSDIRQTFTHFSCLFVVP